MGLFTPKPRLRRHGPGHRCRLYYHPPLAECGLWWRFWLNNWTQLVVAVLVVLTAIGLAIIAIGSGTTWRG